MYSDGTGVLVGVGYYSLGISCQRYRMSHTEAPSPPSHLENGNDLSDTQFRAWGAVLVGLGIAAVFYGTVVAVWLAN